MLNKTCLDNALKFACATARGHCESALALERQQQRGAERAGRFLASQHPGETHPLVRAREGVALMTQRGVGADSSTLGSPSDSATGFFLAGSLWRLAFLMWDPLVPELGNPDTLPLPPPNCGEHLGCASASGVGKRVKAVFWFFKRSVSLKALSSSDSGKEDLLSLKQNKSNKQTKSQSAVLERTLKSPVVRLQGPGPRMALPTGIPSGTAPSLGPETPQVRSRIALLPHRVPGPK